MESKMGIRNKFIVVWIDEYIAINAVSCNVLQCFIVKLDINVLDV